jgi:hypothetical protein
VADMSGAKVSSDADWKNGLAKSRRALLTNARIAELRRELQLIDETIDVLLRLSRYRQRNRPAKSPRLD